MEIVRSSKRAREETADFISELPDTILVHILSFLPLGDAIKTALLRRFGNLWRSIPVLDLNECLYHECGADSDGDEEYDNQHFVGILHHVSILHDVGVLMDRLSLKFWFPLEFSQDELNFHDPIGRKYAETEKATSSDIEKLVGYAINRQVKVLDLNFRGCSIISPGEFYILPDVFRSNYLTDLRLDSCDIKLCGEISLSALRVLWLNKVYSLRDEIMENILLGCPLLEDLSLIDCYGLRILFCKNPNLKKLMITVSTAQNMLHVSCPHVKSLEIAGWIERATLHNVSSLIDASLSFGYLFKSELRAYDEVHRLLRAVSRCKTVTPCTYTILMLTISNFRGVRCASYKWKNLIIKLLNLHKWHYPGLSWLFKSSVSLETLTMFINPGSESCFKREALNWISAYEFDGESYWDLQEASFPCLECITIHGYITEPYVIQMLKFLLKNTPKLQKVVISVKETLEANWRDNGMQNDQFRWEKLQELVQELWLSPRASLEARIHVT